jgi:hypothetical protein
MASGQKLNNAKTFIFFNKNTGKAFKDFIGSSVGFSATRGYEKYLGLYGWPIKEYHICKHQSRVQRRMEGWNERFLSQAWKEVLIKAVIQVISTYNMCVFQLLKTLCKRLNSLISWFW